MDRSYPPLTQYARAGRRRHRLNVLVVAPHPDDDVIGCGGTLQRLASRGARITVLYVTDGSASHVKSKRFPPEVLRDLREGEARDALRALGIRPKTVFLRAPDSGLAGLAPGARAMLAAAIARAVDRGHTQLLLAPWHRDPHPDHIETAALVSEACRIAVRRPATLMYGVWLPVRGTAGDVPLALEANLREIKLSPAEVERKRAAILAHRTQSSDLIDDDPEGFRIDTTLLDAWLKPVERFYVAATRYPGKSEDDRPT